MKRTMDLLPVKVEILSPQAFLRLSSEQKSNIERSEVVVPVRNASRHFAEFKVYYKRPIYKAKF